MSKPEYYERLGVSMAASQGEITAAYRRLATLLHPDRHVNDSPELQEEYARRMRAVNEAYATLQSPQKRAEYDRFYAGHLANPWDGLTADGFSPAHHAIERDSADSRPGEPPSDEFNTEEAGWSDGWDGHTPFGYGYLGPTYAHSARSRRGLVLAILLLLGGAYAGFQALLAPAALGPAFIMPIALLMLALLIFIIAVNR
jgi:curved DNA-binding protein CbpA